ncbi:MAG: DUF192 domain-containing protein [Candidatus Omnitrophica bacterium]|jgi:hypothetical protein|nr:DUF192 domain-containing protein [Candidatus Omnitrophota bacterium]
MRNIRFKLLLVFLVLLLSGLIFWLTAIFRFPLEQKRMEVSGKQLIVWVADTYDKRLQGLQNIIWMPKDRGMLFIFDSADRYCFWNKNTLMPLKLIFMRQGIITEEIELVPIWKGKQTVCPRYEADSVIEVIDR